MQEFLPQGRDAGAGGGVMAEDAGVSVRLPRILPLEGLLTCSLKVPVVLQSGVYWFSRSRRGFPRGEHAPQVWVSHVASKYVVARSVAKCLSDLRTVPVA